MDRLTLISAEVMSFPGPRWFQSKSDGSAVHGVYVGLASGGKLVVERLGDCKRFELSPYDLALPKNSAEMAKHAVTPETLKAYSKIGP